MHILTLCGSTRPDSSNARLLRAFAELDAELYPESDNVWTEGPTLGELPLFTTEALERERAGEAPEVFTQVAELRATVAAADVVLIATPEYAHNLPAALKSALEWTVASGEFAGKRVVAMTGTPHPPRGEHCMQSLVWTLQALDARVLAEVPLYGVSDVREEGLREMMGAVLEATGAG